VERTSSGQSAESNARESLYAVAKGGFHAPAGFRVGPFDCVSERPAPLLPPPLPLPVGVGGGAVARQTDTIHMPSDTATNRASHRPIGVRANRRSGSRIPTASRTGAKHSASRGNSQRQEAEGERFLVSDKPSEEGGAVSCKRGTCKEASIRQVSTAHRIVRHPTEKIGDEANKTSDRHGECARKAKSHTKWRRGAAIAMGRQQR
jgi:hypothetical protein